jgi:hypothetical protein
MVRFRQSMRDGMSKSGPVTMEWIGYRIEGVHAMR